MNYKHNISLDIIKMLNLNINCNLNIINKLNNIKYIYKKPKHINKCKLNKQTNKEFYKDYLYNDFVSNDILNYVFKKLHHKNEYIWNHKHIVIYHNNNIPNKFIEEVYYILNLFDYITNKKNNYQIIFYLTKCKKKLDYNYNYIGPKNVNSGATLPSHFIYIWRLEEWKKVLIHEIIHYLFLDINKYQDRFKKLYNDINLETSIINPNEGYTELVALFIMSIYKYNYYKNFYNIDISIYDFINKRLTIELGWSFYQITKILKFFNCYQSYEELFTKKCVFRQKSNVLSYYILKTYFLYNINDILKDFKFNDIFINENKVNYIYNKTNIREKSFTKNINYIMNNYTIKDNSMTFTCIN